MEQENNAINRNVSISDFHQCRATDSRTTSEVRKSITKRVDGTYLPRSLSPETRKEIIQNLVNTSTSLINNLNHIKQRHWISELCEFDYNGDKGRCYTFNKAELQKIDFTLKKRDINKEGEVDENPERIERMRIE